MNAVAIVIFTSSLYVSIIFCKSGSFSCSLLGMPTGQSKQNYSTSSQFPENNSLKEKNPAVGVYCESLMETKFSYRNVKDSIE